MTSPRQRLMVDASDDSLHIPLPRHLPHRRLAVTLEAIDEPIANPWATPNRAPEHIKRVLAESWGVVGVHERRRNRSDDRKKPAQRLARTLGGMS